MEDLNSFLQEIKLSHLSSTLMDQDITFELLLEANDHELSQIVPKISDKIKLRSALDKLRDGTLSLNSSKLETQNCSYDFKPHGTDRRENLRQVLSSITAGKILLAKADKGEKLKSVDRALLVKIIVEAQINTLDEHNRSIRKEVWQRWGEEVSELFTGENPEVYYVPYHVIAGKVIQASGLLHNRLITHRRYLNAGGNKKRSVSTSSDNSDSGASSSKDTCKRFRPLPDNFNESFASSAKKNEVNIEWLKCSSSPKDLVIEKWNATLNSRLKILTNTSIKDYLSMFPGLNLPDGYELLLNDFNTLYPNAAKSFKEKFPVIKNKLLALLAEKSDTVKPDQIILDLLSSASVSEESKNLAAFLSITTLLRKMHTISVPRRKVLRLSREEVRSSFIARVTTPADIDRYCADKEALFVTRGIPEQPYIIAVGASWSTVSHYEIVICKGFRYPQKDICQAVKTTFSIYWALDCAYSKDSAPCWMFVQRTMFDMVSKYDIEGVPLRELLSKFKS